MKGKRKDYLKGILLNYSSLTVYRALMDKPLYTGIKKMLQVLVMESADLEDAVNKYCEVVSLVFEDKSSLKSQVIRDILGNLNSFTRLAETNPENAVSEYGHAVEKDLRSLYSVASLSSSLIVNRIKELAADDKDLLKLIGDLPGWDGLTNYELKMSALMYNLLNAEDWSNCISEITAYINRHGAGVFNNNKAFIWYGDKKGFEAVVYPDPVTFDDLALYEIQKNAVIKNTEKFLNDVPANNLLLYGDRGTGKSSMVKAVMNKYSEQGLRLIEIPKKYLDQISIVTGLLGKRGLKYIIFIDDLAFEDNEERYTSLKAVLEGSLEGRPKNILVYATSNRRHLIKETFKDRQGLLSSDPNEEVRARDNIQEKLSLADRFGMTVVFPSTDKKEYLAIVKELASLRRIKIDSDILEQKAMQWELSYNGRSPRTAKQFIDWLEGELSIGGL